MVRPIADLAGPGQGLTADWSPAIRASFQCHLGIVWWAAHCFEQIWSHLLVDPARLRRPLNAKSAASKFPSYESHTPISSVKCRRYATGPDLGRVGYVLGLT